MARSLAQPVTVCDPWSWTTDWSGPLVKLGASLTGFTVRTNSSKPVVTPSLTVIRMAAPPFWSAAGVTVTVRSAPEPPRTMLATGTRAGSEEVAGSA